MAPLGARWPWLLSDAGDLRFVNREVLMAAKAVK
jgi:hypothetical protein